MRSEDSELLNCLRCSAAKSADASECTSCGIVFSRWKEPLDRAGPELQTSPALASLSPSTLVLVAVAVIVLFGAIRSFTKGDPSPPPVADTGKRDGLPVEEFHRLELPLPGSVTARDVRLEPAENDASLANTGQAPDVIAGAFWNVEGTVYDLFDLRPLSGGTLQFTGPVSVDAPIGFNGFSASLPESRRGFYLVGLNPPSGYTRTVKLFAPGALARVPRDERLIMSGAIAFQGGVRSRASIDIAVVPDRQMTQEEHDLAYPPAAD